MDGLRCGKQVGLRILRYISKRFSTLPTSQPAALRGSSFREWISIKCVFFSFFFFFFYFSFTFTFTLTSPHHTHALSRQCSCTFLFLSWPFCRCSHAHTLVVASQSQTLSISELKAFCIGLNDVTPNTAALRFMEEWDEDGYVYMWRVNYYYYYSFLRI